MALATNEHDVGRIANERALAQVSVPFVSGGNFGEGVFTSVARSTWSFQQAQTSIGPQNFDLSVYVGGPVEVVLVVASPGIVASVQYLTDLGHPKYKLAEVLAVTVEKSGDQFIAREARHEWYGYGNSEERAVASFASGLVEELEGLASREDRLSQRLQEELRHLRSVVIPRS